MSAGSAASEKLPTNSDGTLVAIPVDIHIGKNVVIGDNVTISYNVEIFSHVRILDDIKIDDQCKINCYTLGQGAPVGFGSVIDVDAFIGYGCDIGRDTNVRIGLGNLVVVTSGTQCLSGEQLPMAPSSRPLVLPSCTVRFHSRVLFTPSHPTELSDWVRRGIFHVYDFVKNITLLHLAN